jgi:hypothetical protein
MFSKCRVRRFNLIWIDKGGLSLAAAVLLVFLVLWLLLILAAGSAPTGRLSLLCLQWTTNTVLKAVFPVWLIARGIYAMAPHAAQAFASHRKTVPHLSVVQLADAA